MKKMFVLFIVLVVMLGACAGPAPVEVDETTTTEVETTTELEETITEATTTTPVSVVRDEDAQTRFMQWFPLGMSTDELLRALDSRGFTLNSAPDQTAWLAEMGIYHAVHDGRWHEPIGASFYYAIGDVSSGITFQYFNEHDGRLSMVGVRESQFATPEGIRVGDSRELVAATYELFAPTYEQGFGDMRPAQSTDWNVFTPLGDNMWLGFAFWDNDNPNIMTGWSYGFTYFWQHRN